MNSTSGLMPSSSSRNDGSNQTTIGSNIDSKKGFRLWLKALRADHNEHQSKPRTSNTARSIRGTQSNQARLSKLDVPGLLEKHGSISLAEFMTHYCTPAILKSTEKFAEVAGERETRQVLEMILSKTKPQIQLLISLYEKVRPEVIYNFLTQQFGVKIIPISNVGNKLIPDYFVDIFHKMNHFEYLLNIVHCSQIKKMDISQLHDQIVNALIKSTDNQKTNYVAKYDTLKKIDTFLNALEFKISNNMQDKLSSKLKELESKRNIEKFLGADFLKYLDEQSPKHYAAAMSLLKYPSLNAVPLKEMQTALNTFSLSQMLYIFSAYPSNIKSQLESFTYQDPQLNQAKVFNVLNETFISHLDAKPGSQSGYSVRIEFIQNLKNVLIQKNQMLMVKVFERQYFPLLIQAQTATIPEAFFSRFKGRWANMLALQRIHQQLDENQFKIAHMWDIDSESPVLENAKNQAKQRLEVTTQLAYEKFAVKVKNSPGSYAAISQQALLDAIVSCIGDGAKDAASLSADIDKRRQHHLEFWQNMSQRYDTAVNKMPYPAGDSSTEGQARAVKFNAFLKGMKVLVESELYAQSKSDTQGQLGIPVLAQFELIKNLDIIENALDCIDYDNVQNINPGVDNLSLFIDKLRAEHNWHDIQVYPVFVNLVPKLADKLLLQKHPNTAGLTASRYQISLGLRNALSYQDLSNDLHEEISHYINTVYQLKNLPARIHSPQECLEQMILPLVDAVKFLKKMPNGALQTALDEELKRTLSDLNSRVPQRVLATSLLIANGQDNGFETKLVQSLQDLGHKSNSVSEAAINILEGLLKLQINKDFAPLVNFAHDYIAEAVMRTKSGTIAQLNRKAEDRNPHVREANRLLDEFTVLFSSNMNDPNHIKDLFVRYKQTLAKKHSEKWVQDLVGKKLSECRKEFLPPKDNEELKSWRNQYQSLLPLIAAAELSPVVFAPADVRKNNGINMQYLYSDEDVEALLNFSVNVDLKQSSSGQSNPVTVALSASDANEVQSKVFHWLKGNNDVVEASKSKLLNRSREALLVIPFCPIDEKGESTNHWTGIIITQNTAGHLQAGYIDTLSSVSELPISIKKAITNSVDLLNAGNKLAKLQLKPDNELVMQHSEQQDITSCGSLLAHNLKIVIEKWQQNKSIQNVIATTKSALEIRNEQLQEFGDVTSDFATRQMWDIHPVDSINRQDLLTQDKLVTSIVKTMGLMPEKRLNEFMETLNGSLISPYLEKSVRAALFYKKLSLTPVQIVDKSYRIYQDYERMQKSIAALKQVNKPLFGSFEKVFKPIIAADDEHFDPTSAIKAIKNFLIQHQKEFGSAAQKEIILKGFFPKYDKNKKQDLAQLDLCSIEAIRIHKQMSSMLIV